ncbi:hypothetical protein GIX45_24575 [Erwinia sp. CPCC 100877]|nr:hypothetical protein [Erwinia sp. CPCC 100877]
MDFQTIKEKIPQNDPQTFLTYVLEEVQKDDELFVFSSSIKEQFEQNCQFLASAETVSSDDLAHWQTEGFLVVAQTIDGDYIAGTTTQTFVIPVSLYKADIETYDLFLTDFFIAYEKGTLSSKILPIP